MMYMLGVRRLSTRAAHRYQYLASYKYLSIAEDDLPALRTHLARSWAQLGARGRVYLATEGFNAQVTIPHAKWQQFVEDPTGVRHGEQAAAEESARVHRQRVHGLGVASRYPELASALREGAGKCEKWFPARTSGVERFRKLRVSVRKAILTDDLEPELAEELDLERAGTALTAEEWHRKLLEERDQGVVLDVRNVYESDVGHFRGARPLGTMVYSQSFEALDTLLRDVRRETPIYTYCTGGIRCEKVASFLTQTRGFQQVYRLDGGINAYHAFKKERQLDDDASLFVGRNLSFDDHLEEGPEDVLTEDVVGACYQCGAPTAVVSTCVMMPCRMIFLQCASCRGEYAGTCSLECKGALDYYGARGGGPQQVEECEGFMEYEPRRVFEMAGQNRLFLPSLVRLGWRSLKGGVEMQPPVPELEEKLVSREEYEREQASEVEPPFVLTPKVVRDYSMDVSRVDVLQSDMLKEVRHATRVFLPERAHMMMGPVEAGLLHMLVAVSRPKRVLELGTFTAYSTLVMADAMEEGSELVTCESSAAAFGMASVHLERYARGGSVHVDSHFTDAMSLLRSLRDGGAEPVDFVFIDCDKRGYWDYVQYLLRHEMLRKGGLVVVDNTLWKGAVPYLDAEGELAFTEDKREEWRFHERTIPTAQALDRFNRRMAGDARVEVVNLPGVHDGVSLLRRVV